MSALNSSECTNLRAEATRQSRSEALATIDRPRRTLRSVASGARLLLPQHARDVAHRDRDGLLLPN